MLSKLTTLFIGFIFPGILMASDLPLTSLRLDCTESMVLAGHRGMSADYIENTLLAAKMLFKANYKVSEFDAWLTKDGHVVINHDEDMKRLAKGFLPGQEGDYQKIITTPVDKQPYSDLRKIDLGDGQYAATYEEFLSILPGDALYLAEIKGSTAVADSIVSINREKNIHPDKVIFISFDLQQLIDVKKKYPDYKVFYVVEGKQIDSEEKYREVISKVVDNKLDGLDVEADYLTKFMVEFAHKNKKFIGGWVYHVDTKELADQVDKTGADFHTSNLPKNHFK